MVAIPDEVKMAQRAVRVVKSMKIDLIQDFRFGLRLALNCTSNRVAIQHSLSGQHSLSSQHIEVTVQKRDGTSELVMTDYGIGIPADALPHIFERFFRSDQSRSRASGGFGLGLAIVHAIVVKYRGTIAVQCVIVQGTTFAVRFPAGLCSGLRGLLIEDHLRPRAHEYEKSTLLRRNVEELDALRLRLIQGKIKPALLGVDRE